MATSVRALPSPYCLYWPNSRVRAGRAWFGPLRSSLGQDTCNTSWSGEVCLLADHQLVIELVILPLDMASAARQRTLQRNRSDVGHRPNPELPVVTFTLGEGFAGC